MEEMNEIYIYKNVNLETNILIASILESFITDDSFLTQLLK